MKDARGDYRALSVGGEIAEPVIVYVDGVRMLFEITIYERTSDGVFSHVRLCSFRGLRCRERVLASGSKGTSADGRDLQTVAV